MATLFNTRISDTYPGLIKTTDNAAISATLKQLSDGSGNLTGLYLNNAGDFKVTSILEFGSLKDTAENIVITKFVDSADGIPNNNNDTSIPTSKAVKDFVETHVTAQDLDFRGDDASVAGDVDLDSEAFIILGTANEIETTVTSAGGNTLQIGIPTNPALSGNVGIAGNIDFADNAKARFGAGPDLEIYHDGSNSYIDEIGTGSLYIKSAGAIRLQSDTGENMIYAQNDSAVNLYFNNSNKFQTTISGANVTGDLTVTGSITGSGGSFLPLAGGTMTGDTIHNDDVKSIYGTSSDGLEIYHDSSHSYLKDSGTGELKLLSSSVAIQSASGNEYIAYFAGTGSQTASLYAANSKKLETSSTGVTITGRLSGLTDPTQNQDAATKAYVDALDAASDLDFSDGSTASSVDLNTETFAIIGTANEVETTASGQQLQIGLPSSISVNSASATALQTARDISLTGQATATISSFDGSSNVSGAVTLDNNSVTGKVLTGLASPTASNILASDSILQAFGKAQSQINTLAGGLRFMGTWNANTNTPTLQSGGGEADSGTTTGTATNKLIQSGQNFTSTVTNGDKVINQASGATALVTNVDSNTQLTLDADIMVSGQEYTIDNSPFITQGHYFVVSVGGTSSLNGLSNWAVGDWVIAGAGNVWEKLDHTQVDGTGTAGKIAKFSSTNVIADSIMTESSSTISVTGQLSTTQTLTSGGDVVVNGNKINMGTMMLEDSASGRLGFNRNTATGAIHDSNYNAFQFNGTDAAGANGMLEIQEYAGSGGYAGSTYISGNNIKLNAYIIHNNDTNTFYGFPSNDNYNLTTNGSTQMSADGTNTYLHHDGTKKLETTSTGVAISNVSSGTSQASFGGLSLVNTNTTANNGSAVSFAHNAVSSGSHAKIGAIYVDRTGSSEDTDLFLGTLGGGSYAERIRIKSTGQVGIGTDNPQALLNLSQANGANIRFDNPTTSKYFTIGEGVGTNGVFSFRGNSYQSTDTMSVDFVNNRVGIGVIDPDYTLHVYKAVGDTEVYINGQNGQSSIRMGLDARNWQIKTAAAPYLWSLNYVGTDVPLSNIITAKVSGQVGFGTDSPTGKVEIQHPQQTTQFDRDCFLRLHPSAQTDSGGFTNMFFGTSTTNNYGVAIGGLRAGSTDSPSFIIRMQDDSITGTEAMRILPNADFCIGNSVVNPASGFATQKGIGFDISDGQTQMASTADVSTLVLGRNNATDGSILEFRKQSNVMGTIGSNTTSGQALLDLKANQNFRIVTANTEVIRINSSQKVGIGTQNQLPEVLNVNGNIITVGNSTNTGYDRYLKLYGNTEPSTNTHRWAGLAVYNNGGNNVNELAFFTGSGDSARTEKVRIDASGNLGVGTENPQNKFVVANGTDNTQNVEIAPNYIQSFNRQAGNLGYASLDFYAQKYNFNQGFVGINESTPDTYLHIKNTSGDNRGIKIENTVTTSYAEIQLKAASEFRLGTGGTGVGPNGTFYIYDATAGRHRLDIDVDGNVGIGGGAGVLNANSRLDIRQATDGVALELHNTGGNADDYIDIKMIAGNTTAGTLGTILRHQRQGTGGGSFRILTNPTLTGTPRERFVVLDDGVVQINSDSASTNQAVYQQTLTVHKGLSAAGTVVPIAFVDHTHALDIKVTIKQNTSNVATGIGHSVCAYGTANTGMTTVSGSGNVTGITLAYLNTNPSGQDYVLTLTWAGSGASPEAYVTIEGTSTGRLAEY